MIELPDIDAAEESKIHEINNSLGAIGESEKEVYVPSIQKEDVPSPIIEI